MEPRNRFQGMNSASLCRLAGRYDYPIPPRFLTPIDSLKISAQIQNLPNCFTTPNKMTSEDDIKGFVSLKFLRPWSNDKESHLFLQRFEHGQHKPKPRIQHNPWPYYSRQLYHRRVPVAYARKDFAFFSKKCEWRGH